MPKQTNRENYAEEPIDFYRNSTFIPYLDNLISQLESRFHQIKLSAIRALHLIPKNLDSLTREFQTDVLKCYGEEASTVHKAHSSWKFLKNGLHSAMSEDPMNVVMLLYIHKDLYLNYDQVIDDSPRRNPWKMLLVNSLGQRILISLANVFSL